MLLSPRPTFPTARKTEMAPLCSAHDTYIPIFHDSNSFRRVLGKRILPPSQSCTLLRNRALRFGLSVFCIGSKCLALMEAHTWDGNIFETRWRPLAFISARRPVRAKKWINLVGFGSVL